MSRDLRESTHFAILLFARSGQTAIYRRKWQTPAAAKPPVINGRQSRPAHSRHFPILLCKMVCATRKWQKCGDNRFRDYVAAIAAMDSRSRENDGDIKSPSSQMALCAISIRRPAAS